MNRLWGFIYKLNFLIYVLIFQNIIIIYNQVHVIFFDKVTLKGLVILFIRVLLLKKQNSDQRNDLKKKVTFQGFLRGQGDMKIYHSEYFVSLCIFA